MIISQPWDRAGISYRQYDYWVTKGYIEGGHPGFGNPREMTRTEFTRLSQMATLVRNGMSPESAHAFVVAGKASAIIEAMRGDDG